MKMPIQFRRTSLLTKLLILLVMVSCVAILVAQQSERRENAAEALALEKQIAELIQENQDLQSDISGLGSDESVKKIAREELGLVGSDEIIFSDVRD